MISISILKERNIRRGVLCSCLITLGSYITVSIISIIMGFIFAGIYLFGDVHFLLGTIVGVIITLRNRNENQGILKYGAFTGVIGGIFSSILISLYQLILIAIIYGPDISIFFIYLGISIISGIAIGLIGGGFLATYFMYKEMKEETKKEKLDDRIDDEFFDDLIN